jgi:hypothetical protein
MWRDKGEDTEARVDDAEAQVDSRAIRFEAGAGEGDSLVPSGNGETNERENAYMVVLDREVACIRWGTAWYG